MKRFLFLLALASALAACGGGDPEDQVFYGSNPLYPAQPGDFVGPPTPR